TGSGFAVNVTGKSGGTIALSGQITDNGGSGSGINLTSNTGATINLTGGVSLSTGASPAFTATGGGTVNVTGSANTLATTTGTALNVANTTIGASGLSFKSIAANGAANGIVLNTTGSRGGLTVSGNANSSVGGDSSGGTIQNTTGTGISLISTMSPSFTNMNIQSTSGSGISGTGVTNFTFKNGTINNSGTGLGVDTSNISLNAILNGSTVNVSGAVTITGNTLTNSFYHGIDIGNWAGTVSDMNISNNTFTSSTVSASANGSAIRVGEHGSASTVANVTKAELNNNTITNFPGGAGILFQTGNLTSGGPSGTYGSTGTPITMTGSSIKGASASNLMGTQAINVSVADPSPGSGGGGTGVFDIENNGSASSPLADTAGVAIACSAFGNVTVVCTINNNVIDQNSNVNGQPGIAVGGDGNGDTSKIATLTSTISNNSIKNTQGNGILATNKAASGLMKFKIQNNTVAAPLGGVRPGIRVDSGNNTAGENTSVCLNISGNTSAGSGGTQGIGLRKQGTVPTTDAFAINGMTATSSPGVESYVDGLNPAGGGTLLISATSGFSNCSLP